MLSLLTIGGERAIIGDMLPLETTPTALTPKIRDFCHGIVPSEQAVFVQVQPAEGAERGHALENVARYAAQFGGSSVPGWCIWERPRVNLHAAFHAVWKSSSGELLDVTPNEESQVLFLPDPKLVWEGEHPGHFLPLVHWREIQDYLAASARIQPGILGETDASVGAELKRAAKALEKRLGRA